MTDFDLNAHRVLARSVLADFRRELATAPPRQPPGRAWMLRLADALGDLLNAMDAEPEPESRRLAAIRSVLARFDWERDDRQYALERIEQIAGSAPAISRADPDGSAFLIPADRETVLAALAHAAEWLTDDEECRGCQSSPTGLCLEHTQDTAAKARYQALARALGGAR